MKQNRSILGAAYMTVVAGIVATVLLCLPQLALPAPAFQPDNRPQTVSMPAVEQPAATPTTRLSELKTAIAATIEANRTSRSTPVPANLPDVPPPPNGTIYFLTPEARDVGWVRVDEERNHFGDANIYAGVHEGQIHVGGIRFDLSAIPAGSSIIHADLTLTGLSDQRLGNSGEWTVEMLEPWMDDFWVVMNSHWMQRTESALGALRPTLTVDALGPGVANTFFVPVELLPQLEARIYSGSVSFRVLGPKEATDNLFAWDSGYDAVSTGQGPLLRLVAGPAPAVPPPSPTARFVIVTPVNVIQRAAEIQTAEARTTPYTGTGTPRPLPTYTPYPPNWIEPIIVTETPTPLNAATAEWIRQVKAAEAIVYGTPTATPPWVWTATSTPLPTATSYFIDVDKLTPTPTLTPTPQGVPAFLSGKIMFYSDRTGSNRLWLIDPDGTNLALWQGDSWVYERAKEEDTIAPDGSRHLAVQREQVTVPQIFVLSPDGRRQQITYFKVVSYDPAWSPVGDSVLFVSAESGNDEIYRIQADGNGLQQLTRNDWEWDKHPSWSPDGQQIVFFSNRTGKNQIFVMNADGSNVRRISDDVSNDAYPVWIK